MFTIATACFDVNTSSIVTTCLRVETATSVSNQKDSCFVIGAKIAIAAVIFFSAMIVKTVTIVSDVQTCDERATG